MYRALGVCYKRPVDRLTLREAARRTARSVTTLRRYIRSGRLGAEKLGGRFGPEYFVTEFALRAAGLDPSESSELPEAMVPAHPQYPAPIARAHGDVVPTSIYLELQMKHEQLLVQYGMVRVAGLRTLELQTELESRRARMEALEAETARLSSALTRESEALGRRLAELELELEGTRLERDALRGKVEALEMFRRNSRTSDAIDRRFDAVLDQLRRVESLERDSSPAAEPRPAPARPGSLAPEH